LIGYFGTTAVGGVTIRVSTAGFSSGGASSQDVGRAAVWVRLEPTS
jgi:hypothetical protein